MKNMCHDQKISMMLLIILLIAGFPDFSWAETDVDEMEVVFFNPDSGSQNPVDATNALQTFCNVINKQMGWNLRAYYFKKQKDLDKFLDERKVDLGILSQIYFVENYRKRNMVPFCIPVRDGKTTYRKVVVVRNDKGYLDLQDLKGKKLAATALGEENIPFHNIVVFQGEIDVETHFSEIKLVDSANSAIMAVLYGEVDAAAVTMASFTIMQDLNPQVKSKLKSIFTSAESPISPMVYFVDNIDPTKIDKLHAILLNMHNNPVGRQSMLSFQVEAWEKTSIADFIETERLLKEYAKNRPKASSPPVSTAGPAATPRPTEVAAVPETTLPVISRIQSYTSDDGKQLLFSVQVDQVKPGIDQAATILSYKINNSSIQKIRMEPSGKNKFQAIVQLPEKSESEGKEVIHVIKPGDTLGKLASRYLGDAKKYNLIAQYNNITNPNIIMVGQQLRIKTGETTVIEVTYFVTARDKEGREVSSPERTKYF